METEKEIKIVNVIVLELLEKDERCRNDDKWLTYQVMRKFTNIYISFQDFEKIPTFETISRVRRKIQNVDKKFLATDENIIKKRQSRQKIFKNINNI